MTYQDTALVPDENMENALAMYPFHMRIESFNFGVCDGLFKGMSDVLLFIEWQAFPNVPVRLMPSIYSLT